MSVNKSHRTLILIIKKIISFFGRCIALLAIIAIKLIRPMLGPPNICPFTIGCTPFAIDQLSTQPLHRACINIFKRLLQCHPFGKRL